MRTSSDYPLGYLAANRVVELGRSAFFGSPDADLPQDRSPLISADDKIPQFGYVGPRYRETGVLLLGINPGNGGKKTRNSGDAKVMPALASFVELRSPESFVEAQHCYRAVCEDWGMWKQHCSEVISAGRLSLDEIAYSNCLPWRTHSQAGFAAAVAERAAKLYVLPLVQELQPRVIVAMGKRAAGILPFCEAPLPTVVTWNRAHAATSTVRQERAAAADRIFKILGR